MTSPEQRRKHLYKKAQERPFQFPRAVAWVLATAYEPRQQPRGYPEAFERQLDGVKRHLHQVISEISQDTRGIHNSAGELEKTCRAYIKQLRAAANDHELHDVIEQLDHAMAISNGRRQPPPLHDKQPVRFRKLPQPRIAREGRPPVGYWR